jgi:hypothetical protein
VRRDPPINDHRQRLGRMVAVFPPVTRRDVRENICARPDAPRVHP